MIFREDLFSYNCHLEVTCGRYLDSQRPMLSPSDYARTEAAVKEFENGLGRELDSRDSVQTGVHMTSHPVK